jgi:hypothetical protein
MPGLSLFFGTEYKIAARNIQKPLMCPKNAIARLSGPGIFDPV